MASLDKISHIVDSEMEEGEIVDELDDLSDISSEEEFLLRQRLEVLENYNNVLERKKKKRSGFTHSREILCDLSDISTAEFEDVKVNAAPKSIKITRYDKYNRTKRRQVLVQDENFYKKKKEHRRKPRTKKRVGVKLDSESSEESEDEYRNKRQKLADAVVVNRGNNNKSDTTSLSARLKKMLHSDTFLPVIDKSTNDDLDTRPMIQEIEHSPVEEAKISDSEQSTEVPSAKPIEISSDEQNKEVPSKNHIEILDTTTKEINSVKEKDSDDDLELLRQHALNTKTAKPIKNSDNTQHDLQVDHKTLSEDEDSDTAELRIICLKSALLKKAIEMKQKQKMQKKLSQSTNLDDDLFNDCNIFATKEDSDNNTDIESVDMEIGSDGDDKLKDNIEDVQKVKNDEFSLSNDSNVAAKKSTVHNTAKEDELEEDEDLLRAKLLTSLSKNLPNLVSPEILDTVVKEKVDDDVPKTKNPTTNVPEEKRFIIKLDDTDSEGEHEATKNLTKMHIKLSEQIDFQQKLDLFLKTTRLQVEKTKLPDVVQQETLGMKPQKFVAKAVTHLPKSEQIEYKNLVRRMAELEKMKQSRQAAINLINHKDTLKPRNVTIDTSQRNKNIDEQISLSRKKIAEESAKMLKLKEEATKLSQRYKIAATELRNITTAITLNKKQQRAVHNCLAKIRLQHQSLLKSSTNTLHSKVNGRIPNLSHLSTKVVSENRLQKENFPKDEYKNLAAQKTVKVSVVNNLKSDGNSSNELNTRLSVKIDVTNNKKVVKVTKHPGKDRQVAVESEGMKESIHSIEGVTFRSDSNLSINDKEERVKFPDQQSNESNKHSSSDYKSPLDALGVTTWKADPNAILCPFEVDGQCKDPDCKYLHTQPL